MQRFSRICGISQYCRI